MEKSLKTGEKTESWVKVMMMKIEKYEFRNVFNNEEQQKQQQLQITE